MKTKAVLLDKDGTLMEFDAFWRTASYGALEDLLRGLGGDLSAVGELLSALGVGNGATDITGALCCGTYKDMGQALYGVLKERAETGRWKKSPGGRKRLTIVIYPTGSSAPIVPAPWRRCES